MAQKYLNLDAVLPSIDVSITLNQKTHKMAVATVDTFVKNIREIEAFPIDGSAADEMEMIVGILRRAFPTIPAQELLNLTVDQLRALRDWTLEAGAEKAETVTEDAEGNAPTAS